MSEEERQAILERLQASIVEAPTLTKAEARRRLVQEGFCDESGKLRPAYGGSKGKS